MDYYNRAGRAVYACAMDLSKAFDLVSWMMGNALFSDLLEKGAIKILFNVPRDTHRYAIESISQCLHVKTMLASRCLSFYETIEASSKRCIRFLSNLCKNDLNTVLGRNLFFIANDCFVNLSDLSKMLVKKQMKYF